MITRDKENAVVTLDRLFTRALLQDNEPELEQNQDVEISDCMIDLLVWLLLEDDHEWAVNTG